MSMQLFQFFHLCFVPLTKPRFQHDHLSRTVNTNRVDSMWSTMRLVAQPHCWPEPPKPNVADMTEAMTPQSNDTKCPKAMTSQSSTTKCLASGQQQSMRG